MIDITCCTKSDQRYCKNKLVFLVVWILTMDVNPITFVLNYRNCMIKGNVCKSWLTTMSLYNNAIERSSANWSTTTLHRRGYCAGHLSLSLRHRLSQPLPLHHPILCLPLVWWSLGMWAGERSLHHHGLPSPCQAQPLSFQRHLHILKATTHMTTIIEQLSMDKNHETCKLNSNFQ